MRLVGLGNILLIDGRLCPSRSGNAASGQPDGSETGSDYIGQAMEPVTHHRALHLNAMEIALVIKVISARERFCEKILDPKGKNSYNCTKITVGSVEILEVIK